MSETSERGSATDSPPGQGAAMDLARFRSIVEAYGGAPSHWPEDERDQALAFQAASAEARVLVEREAALDALLDLQPGLKPDAALFGRILDSAPKAGASQRDKTAGWFAGFQSAVGGFFRPVAVLAASALLGLVLGFVTPQMDRGMSASAEEDLLSVFDGRMFDVVPSGEMP